MKKNIQQITKKFIILRISWLFSNTGHNFIKTILRLAKEKSDLKVVADQYGAPTSTVLIANVTKAIILKYVTNLNGSNHQIFNYDIYHLTAAGQTNWHAFACHIVNQAKSNGLRLKLLSKNITPIKSDEYPLPALRPANSALNFSTISKIFDVHPSNWQIDANKTIEQLSLI